MASSLICLLCFHDPLPISQPTEPGHLLPLSPSLPSFHSPSCPSADTSCSIQTEVSVIEDRVIHKPGKEGLRFSQATLECVWKCRWGSLNMAPKTASRQNGQGIDEKNGWWMEGLRGSNEGSRNSPNSHRNAIDTCLTPAQKSYL